jgi:hypothetical protein
MRVYRYIGYKLQNQRAEEPLLAFNTEIYLFIINSYNLSQSIPVPYKSGGIHHHECGMRIRTAKVACTVCIQSSLEILRPSSYPQKPAVPFPRVLESLIPTPPEICKCLMTPTFARFSTISATSMTWTTSLSPYLHRLISFSRLFRVVCVTDGDEV